MPGTQHVLDPMQGAFNISCMNRWLDYNDTFLFHEWGHPSDNLGTILACAEYVSNVRISEGKAPLLMLDVMQALIKSYEIQGWLGLENSFNSVGLDHVILVKVASTAMATVMLGGDKEMVLNAISQAFVDGHPLRTYRHWPNTGSRKSWAAGDAAMRAVHLAIISLKGEMGYKTCLTAPKWGFYDTLFRGKPFQFQRPLEEHIMENVLFKVSFPAEFHAQTAIEAAIKLHDSVIPKIDQVELVKVDTNLSCIKIIDKKGPLLNEADRDHCLQYMVAIGLLTGKLSAEDYEDSAAADPRIDALREKMIVEEDKFYSLSYLDPDERSITNAIQVEFKDGTKSDKVEVQYPLGHRRRRAEAIPHIEDKFIKNLKTRFPKKLAENIIAKIVKPSLEEFTSLTVPEFCKLFVI